MTILNENEADWVCARLGAHNTQDLSRRFGRCIVKTQEDRGAIISDGRDTHVESASGVKGNVVGAGDAFLAGLLWKMSKGKSAEAAGAFAAALASVVVMSKKIRPSFTEELVRNRMPMERRRTNEGCD